MLRSIQLSRKTKVKLYNELIVPVLIYGSECWALTSKDEMMLLVFERKVLRMIFGAICVNGESGAMTNCTCGEDG